MPGVPLDAMDQMKKAFKGLFKSKKSKKSEPASAGSAETGTPTIHATPSATTPAGATSAAAPEPAKTEILPAKNSDVPAEPAAAAVPLQGEQKKDEAAALTEVKKATETPELVGAVAPAPPTAVSAQAPTTAAPKDAEVKTTSTPAAATQSSDIPAIPSTKPAAGMTATSGPMFDEPNFGEEKPVATAATPAASSATAPAGLKTVDS